MWVYPPVRSSPLKALDSIIFLKTERTHLHGRHTREKVPAKKANKGFEETLWDTANQLRGSVESSEYKHVVLSLVFRSSLAISSRPSASN